jgi:glycosyltransferase involved in cell wall biosynthesis
VRILHIFDGDYPWDVRVEKISATLVDAGHPVRLLCRNRAAADRTAHDPCGMEIVRLPAVPDPLSFPLPLNPLWWAQIRGQIRDFRADLVLVRDLPLAPLAAWLARRAGLPVIADLAEPYPDSLRSQRQFESMSLLDRWLRNPDAAEAVERWVLRRLDRALVVCPEAGWRLERQGLAADRWVEVGNTPRLSAFQARGEPVPELAGLEGRFVLFFSGLLAGDRGLDTAVDALARLEARRPGRFALVVVGDGPVRGAVAEQAARAGLADVVRLPGFIGHDRLPDLIRAADLGLLPFRTCPHIDSTLANKLFEYMALDLPVVVSDAPPMVRILEETEAGVSFPSGDAEALARAVEAIEADPDAAHRMGQAGSRAVRKRYNWDVDAARLLNAVESARGSR